MFVSYRTTCPTPPTATSGAHGLTANVVAASARGATTAGAFASRPGIGGGPSGRPAGAPTSDRSGFFLTRTLLSAVSSPPPSIQSRINFSDASSIFPPDGGITGSISWETTSHR